MLNKLSVESFFLYIFTFLFIFNPSNFFDFNLIYILTLISMIYLFFKKDTLYSLISNKRTFSLIFLCIYLFVYLSILYLLGENDALYRAYVILLVIMAIFCSLMISSMFGRVYGYDFIKIIRFIVNIGFLQLFFVVLALVSPEFREWTLSTARQEDILSISNDEFGGIRSFGLASGYTSTFPMFMGVCSLFCFYLFLYFDKLNYKLFYLLGTFLFTLSVILNARIGLIPLILYSVFFPIFFLLNFKHKSKTLLFLVGLVFITASFSFSKLLNSTYFERLRMGLDDVNNLLIGKASGNFEVLAEMWFFPNNVYELMFGTGSDVFGRYSKGSDIGIVRDIYMYGLLNVLFVSLVLFYVIMPLFKIFSKKFGFLFVIIFINSFFIFYFKGLIFSSNEIMNLLFILIVFCAIYQKQLLKNH